MVKVSICTVTYNHAPYIAQAIESVLAQRGPDLEIEMVIGEDCSTDDTRAIVADYARRYPDVIKPLFHEKNLGPGANSLACLNACTGEFIAALEGDDYWTDSDKLRLQVAALRARPDCMLCFHDAETFNDIDGVILWAFSEKFCRILPRANSDFQSYSQLDIAQWGWFIPTASMLFRASSLPKPMPAWLEGVYSGDFTLQLLSTRQGPALYIPRVMSRYRVHSQNIGSLTAGSVYQFHRRIFEGKMFQKYVFAPENKKHADILLSNQYFGYAHYLGNQGQRWKQLQYFIKASFLNLQRINLFVERRMHRFKNRLYS